MKQIRLKGSIYYRLGGPDGHTPVRTHSPWVLERTLNDPRRVVRKTKVGTVEVSTVFLAIDHNFGHGARQLFETMVFGGPRSGEQERYATWADSERGHRRWVARVRRATRGGRRR